MKFFAIALIPVLIWGSSLQAQTLIGPKVDKSFAVHGFAPVKAKSGETGFLSVFYYKMINYNGKIAICGSYTGTVFDDRNDRLFLRGGRIGTKVALASNLTFLQRVEDFGQARSKGKAVSGGHLFAASNKYALGLPTKCKVSKRAWVPEFTDPDIWIRVPTRRTVMRKG